MAKIQIKSEKLTPFGGIFSIMEQFDALLAQTIDSTLGLRCTLFGYQYSEILRPLMCVYLCGGSCIEDISTHIMKHLSLHPTLRTCSADTILRAIGELTCKNITYKSASGKSYDFNTADKMNCLLIKALLATGQLKSGQEYDFDFDHQFIETSPLAFFLDQQDESTPGFHTVSLWLPELVTCTELVKQALTLQSDKA